jgi:amino acid transporter
MLYGIARRGLVHPSLARVDPQHGTPRRAIVLVAGFSAVGALLGDAVLVPISEVGSLAVGVGWFTSCVAWVALAHRRGDPSSAGGRPAAAIRTAAVGALVAAAIIAMKVLPVVPGSFTRWEWVAFLAWSSLGFGFWLFRRPARPML